MAKRFRWMLLTGLLLLSACNYRLDTRKIEADIEADIERQGRRVTLNTVICPDRVAKQAEAYFRCVGELDSGEIFTINVIQQDDEGNVVWEVPSSKTLINLVSLEAEIQKALSQLVTQQVAVSCEGTYRVNERGDTFECDVVGLVTAGSDRIESVLIKVGAEGDVSWQEVRLPNSVPGAAVSRPASSPDGELSKSERNAEQGAEQGAVAANSTTDSTEGSAEASLDETSGDGAAENEAADDD